MKTTLVLCLLLASCAQPGAKPKIRIAILSGAVAQLHIYMAKHLGFFEREGLDVHLEEFSSTGKTMEALVGGSVEIGASTYEQTVQVASMDRGVKAFFVLFTSPSMVLTVAAGRPQINKVAHLKGRMVGVTSLGSASQNNLSLILIRNGMTLADVTPVAIGTAASAIAAVENAKVDAAMLTSLTFETLRGRRPEITVLVDARTVEGTTALFGVPHIPIVAVASSSRWLLQNPDIARRVVRALTRAGRWIQEHPAEEVAANMPESFRVPGSDAHLKALRLALPAYSVDGRMPPDGPAAVLAYLKVAVDPSLNVDLSKTYTNEYLEGKP